ncbi:MAG: DNA polymerase III subunit gamma/tau [Actinomycetia bacterium]|nr:DNA polymerase III subunit gamma/tau [Actinomycetes bacterium]
MTALYRKYRPQTFEEVIGQEHVVRTLRNAILQDRVRQAYVFAGPRGTGKTSLARILAKALNCDQSPTVTPCGTCESCTAIAAGSSLDVIEMDAASQRGIDDVREIRDRAILQPIARNKVYILDEAHQLTKDAFNALLKLIEEPPPHLVFVFCTTELDRMLPTVRSRCQTFPFSRPRLSDIQPLLRRIADAEKLEAPDPALAQIAHHSRGSYRDAVSTLDQLAASTGGRITISAVRDVLGTIEQDSLLRIVDLLIDGDTAALLNSIEELSERGHDLARLVSDLLEHLRHLLLLQHLTDIPDSLPIEEDSHQRIRSQATAFGEARVLRLIDLLAAALEGIRQGGDPRLPLELALVKISRPEADVGRESILLRLERLEAAAPPGPEQAPGAEAHADAAAKESDVAAVAGGGQREQTASSAQPAPSTEPSAAAAAPLPPLAIEQIADLWMARVVAAVGERSLAAASVLGKARPLALDGERLLVELPAGAAFQRTVVEGPKNVQLLGHVLHEATGRRLEVEFREAADHASSGEDAADPSSAEDGHPAERPASDPGGEAVSDEALVSLLKETFDAEELQEGNG